MTKTRLDIDDRLNFLSHSQGFYFSACAATREAYKTFEHGGSIDWPELERAKQMKFNGLGAAGLTNGAFAIETCLKGLLHYRFEDTKTGRDYGDYTHNLTKLFDKVKSETPELAKEIERNHNQITCNHRIDLVDELAIISNYFTDVRYSHTIPLSSEGSWSKIKHIYTATESALTELISEIKNSRTFLNDSLVQATRIVIHIESGLISTIRNNICTRFRTHTINLNLFKYDALKWHARRDYSAHPCASPCGQPSAV